MNTLILCAMNCAPRTMPGAELRGCLHDMPGEFNWVRKYRYVKDNVNVVVLTEQENTSVNQKKALKEAVANAGPGEWIGYKVSSHGAGPGIVCYDSDWNDDRTFMGAKIFGEIMARSNAKTHMFMSIDACEWGDRLRALQLISPPRQLTPRFVPNPKATTRSESLREVEPTNLLPRGISNLVTMAGCLKGKTCADVQDAMGAYGAFSHYEVPARGSGRKPSEIIKIVNKDFEEGQYEQRAVWTGPDWEWLT